MGLEKEYIRRVFVTFVTAIVLAIAAAIIIVLVNETEGFLISLGKQEDMALIMALSVAVLVFVLPMLPSSKVFPVITTMLVLTIIGIQVFFAGTYATREILKAPSISGESASVIASYKGQITSLDEAIKKLPSDWHTRRKNMIADRAIIADKLAAAVKESKNIPTTKAQTIDEITFWASFAYRIAMELGLVLLGFALKCMFDVKPTVTKQHEQIVEQNTAIVEQKPAPKPIELTPKEHNFLGMTPRGFLKLRWPEVIAKSDSGKTGPFTVYSDSLKKTSIGNGTTSRKAYLDAAITHQESIHDDINMMEGAKCA